MNFEKVRNVIAETLGCDVEAVTMEAKLQEDLGADSLAAMELMMALEEAADISIDDDAMTKMKTVSDIMDYLAAN